MQSVCPCNAVRQSDTYLSSHAFSSHPHPVVFFDMHLPSIAQLRYLSMWSYEIVSRTFNFRICQSQNI